jgi:6-phosphogluconolactonase
VAFRPEVHADEAAVAKAAAERVVGALAGATAKPAAIAVSGGSTPQRLYRLLASPSYAARIDWQRVHWLWTDERIVGGDHRESNRRMVCHALLEHVPIPPANIHPIPMQPSLADAAAAYEQELIRFHGAERLQPGRPFFDMVILGVGTDGHTASLFPGRSELDEARHWAVPVTEAGMEPFLPRVTLTYPLLASSRTVLFLVTGAHKREVMTRIAHGEDLPAARVTSEGQVHWLVDEAAAPAP